MILRIVVTILVYSFLGWLLCDINPNKEYGWLSGIWHGIFFVANWIRSLFWDSLYKAECYTTAYNVFYWIFSVISVLSFIFGGSSRSNRY